MNVVKAKKQLLDFEIDKLTNSIENAVTGEQFITLILPLTKEDLKSVTKKKGWTFNWKYELSSKIKSELTNETRHIVKLVTAENTHIIQGIVSFTVKADHVYMDLIENAPFNRIKPKAYLGVAGNLVAYVCKISFASGCQGFVSFLSKSSLIKHYEESLGAVHEHGQLMVIYPDQSERLVKQYFGY